MTDRAQQTQSKENRNDLKPRDIGLYSQTPLPVAILQIMSHRDAVLLSHLLNLIQTNQITWVEFSTDKVEKKIHYSRRQQDWTIKKLKSRGIVLIKTEGFPAKRYASINFQALRIELEEKGINGY